MRKYFPLAFQTPELAVDPVAQHNPAAPGAVPQGKGTSSSILWISAV